VRALWALAYAREPYLLQRTLRLSLSQHVRSQDAVRVVALVANNPVGTALAWEFFRDNHRQLHEVSGSPFLIDRLIKSVTTVLQGYTWSLHDMSLDSTHGVSANECV
jgi:hypothetical protein